MLRGTARGSSSADTPSSAFRSSGCGQASRSPTSCTTGTSRTPIYPENEGVQSRGHGYTTPQDRREAGPREGEPDGTIECRLPVGKFWLQEEELRLQEPKLRLGRRSVALGRSVALESQLELQPLQWPGLVGREALR